MTDCESIEEEDQPVCTCSECVRALSFVYTGKSCNAVESASGRCTDMGGPNPFVAEYKIADPRSDLEFVATGQAQQGDEIIIDLEGTACLPETLAVTISVPSGGVTQTFTIDASCSGDRGLILTDDYGAFESSGYSCSDEDIHNCVQSVTYNVQVCNEGTEDEQIYEWSLKTKDALTNEETFIDLLENVNADDVTLTPTECFQEIQLFDVNRCVNSSYCTDITANATNPMTGIPVGCSASNEIKFGWSDIESVPPTPSPTYVLIPPRETKFDVFSY